MVSFLHVFVCVCVTIYTQGSLRNAPLPLKSAPAPLFHNTATCCVSSLLFCRRHILCASEKRQGSVCKGESTLRVKAELKRLFVCKRMTYLNNKRVESFKGWKCTVTVWSCFYQFGLCKFRYLKVLRKLQNSLNLEPLKLTERTALIKVSWCFCFPLNGRGQPV